MNTKQIKLPSGADIHIRALSLLDMPALEKLDAAFPELTDYRKSATVDSQLPEELRADATAHGIAMTRHVAIHCTGEMLTKDGQKLRITDKPWDVDVPGEIAPNLVPGDDLMAIREAVDSFGKEEQADAEPFPAGGEPGDEVESG